MIFIVGAKVVNILFQSIFALIRERKKISHSPPSFPTTIPMILYNTTFVLAPQTQQAFLAFMREVYLPALHADSLVQHPRLHRIVPHEEHPEALSYALHFYAEGEVHLQDILSNTGLRLADLLTKQFGEAVLGFSTIMHVVD